MDLFNPAPKTALFSPCGHYRYLLTRTWHPEKKPAVFIMLNPSTADADLDDPTIRRCIGFARAWGHGGIVVVNLYAYRATRPADLIVNLQQVCPPEAANDWHITLALQNAGVVVAAWGATAAPGIAGRVTTVRELVQASGNRLLCLGETKDGHPRHPLYVRADEPLSTFLPNPI